MGREDFPDFLRIEVNFNWKTIKVSNQIVLYHGNILGNLIQNLKGFEFFEIIQDKVKKIDVKKLSRRQLRRRNEKIVKCRTQ